MITQEQVLDALRDCYDPEIPVNIVDLGLIYGVEFEGDDKVHITMTMTFPGCPASAYLHEEVRERVAQLDGVEWADVTVVWEPPWSPEMIAPHAKRMLGLD
jgi:metal-sulfur cluster biosynthetic enzyme